MTATVSGKPANGADLVYTLSREAGQNVGGYVITVTPTEGSNPNYTVTVDTGLFKITPVAITIKADGKTKEYDNNTTTDPELTATVSGKPANGADLVYTLSREAGQNVGGYVITVTPTEGSNPNYTVTVDTGLFKITPVAITIKADGKTKEYDNDASTDPALTATVTGVPANGVAPVYTLSREAGQNVGGYVISVTAEATSNLNYTIAVDTGLFRITPITAIVTIVGNTDTVNYDGDLHTVKGYVATANTPLYDVTTDFTFTPASGATLVDNVIAATRRDAGTTFMGLKGTVAGTENQFANTNPNFSTVTFVVTDGNQTILPINVTVTIVGKTDTKPYDGIAHTVTGFTATANTPLYKVGESDRDFSFTGSATATRTHVVEGTDIDGQTDMGLAESQFANTNPNFDTVRFVVTDGWQKITPIKDTVTIVGASNIAAYDGNEHSVSGYTATAQTSLYDVDNDFTFSGSASAARTNVVEGTDTDGQTDMGLTASQFNNNNTDFSEITFIVTDGYQKITPINVTVTITGHHSTVDYDAEEHVVKGYDVNISNTLYKVTDFTFSGDSTASRTIVGTTYMGLKGTAAGSENQFTNTNTNFGTVTFNVTDGYQKIEPIDVTVTITGHNSTVDYDAEEHVVKGYDVNISNTLYKVTDFTFSGDSTASRTIAGTTYMGLKGTAAGSENQFANTNTNFGTVTFVVTDGYQTINKIDATVTIVGHHNSATFDAAEHTVTGYDVTSFSTSLYTLADFRFIGTQEDSTAKRTVVGTTNMGLAAEKFENLNTTNFNQVTFNVTNGYQTITAVGEVVVTIVGHNNTTNYDGNAHTVTGYDVTNISDPLYSADFINFIGTVNDSTATQTDAGTMNMGLKGSDAGSDCKFENTNTNFASVTFVVTDGYQTINKINATVTVVGANNTAPYDGTEHSVNGYTVTNISTSLYTASDFTFSGTASAARTNVVEGTDADGRTDMGLTASQFTNTNTNFATVTFNVTDGYQVITPINATVTVTGHFNTTPYDGNLHTVTGFDTTFSTALYKGSYFTFSGRDTATRTNVVEGTDADGRTDMGLAASQFSNTNSNFATVTFNVTDGYQVITPINATVTIVGHTDTKVYNGNEQSVSGYEVTNVSDLYDVSYFTYGGDSTARRTDVGASDMGLVEGDFTNTNTNFETVSFSITDGKLTITPSNALTITVPSVKEKTYDGSALSGESSASAAYGSITPTLTYSIDGGTNFSSVIPTITDYGTVNVIVRASCPNYTSVDSSFTLKINKREVMLASDTLEKHYDGTSLVNGLTPLRVEDGFVTGQGATYTFTGSQTLVGQSENKFEYTLNANTNASNYIITKVYGILKVTTNDKPVVITSGDKTWMYDGNEHSFPSYTVTFDGVAVPHITGDSTRFELPTGDTLSVSNLASVTNCVASTPNTFNYTLQHQTYYTNISATQGVLSITENNLPIVITSGDREFDYDGTAHNFPSYTVTYDGNPVARLATDSTKFELPTGDTLTVTNPASITYYYENAANNNTFDYTLDNASNYDASAVSMVNGTISINAMSQTLKIQSLGQTWTYDGNAHNYKHYKVFFGTDEVTTVENDTVFVLPTSDRLTITGAPSITDAGKLANTFTYTLENNILYIGTRDTVIDTLRVNPLTGVEVTVKEHGGETTYDGYEQRVHGYDFVSITNDNGLYSVNDFHYSGIEEDSIAAGRYVGTYPMNILPTDFTNENPNFTDVIFTIQDSNLVIKSNPTVITITAGSAEKLYDGTPLVDSNYTYTPAGVLANGDSLVVTIEGSITDVGQVDNVITDYKVYRNESFNAGMRRMGLRKARPAGYDVDVTNCYTFNIEMVKGTLTIYKDLALTVDSVSEPLCPGVNEGTVKLSVTGGKPATPMYHYSVTGSITGDIYTGTSDSVIRLTNLKPDSYGVMVTEALGNSVTTIFEIKEREVITSANSDITCPANIDTVIKNGGCNLLLVNIGTPVFTTTTSLPSSEITITNNAPADNIYPVGETTVRWVAKSLCGDSIFCDQIVKVSFQTCPDAVDNEGNHYPSVRLGSGCKCWTTENLKSTQYSDGRAIDNVMDYYSFEYPNTQENVNIFGHLYDWYAAADTGRYGSVDSVERAYNMGHRIQGICPDGWYLPSDEDYEELNIYPTTDLRATSYWITTNGVVNTNATGFNSLPGGKYSCANGRFEELMGNSYYWTCHPVYDIATGAMIDYICEKIITPTSVRCNGYSIRCVYDEH